MGDRSLFWCESAPSPAERNAECARQKGPRLGYTSAVMFIAFLLLAPSASTAGVSATIRAPIVREKSFSDPSRVCPSRSCYSRPRELEPATRSSPVRRTRAVADTPPMASSYHLGLTWHNRFVVVCYAALHRLPDRWATVPVHPYVECRTPAGPPPYDAFPTGSSLTPDRVHEEPDRRHPPAAHENADPVEP